MRSKRTLFLGLLSSGLVTMTLFHCVGDVAAPNNPLDSGTPDTTTPPVDGSGGDATNDTSTPIDAGPPSPDGSLAWVQHFNSNVEFAQIAARETPSLSYVAVGGYRNGGGNDAITHIGSFDLPAGGISVSPFIVGLDTQGNPTWVKVPATTLANSGNGGDVIFSSVATDASGDVYVAGWSARANITLAQQHNGYVAFVSKLKADGSAFVWDHVYTGAGVGGPRLAVSGNKLVATISYSGSITYDPNKSFAASANTDIAVFSLDPSTGSTSWASTFGSPNYDFATDVTVDGAGDAWVVGSAKGSVSGTGPGLPLVTKGTGYNGVLFNLSGADGKVTFSKAFGDTGSQDTSAVSIDVRGGAIAMTGTFAGGVDFGKGVVGTADPADGYLVVLDAATKSTRFVGTVAGTSFDTLSSVGIDPWGQVLAVGNYSSTDAKIGTKALKAGTFHVSGMFVAKWDGAGNLLWANSVMPTSSNGTPPYNGLDAAAPYLAVYSNYARVTKNGFIAMAGGMNGGANFGDGIYRPRLSGLGPENFQFCPINQICPAIISPDSLVGAWVP